MTEPTSNDTRAAIERYRDAAEHMKGVTTGLAGVLGVDEAARLLTVCATGLLVAEHGPEAAAIWLRRWADELQHGQEPGRVH